MKKLLKIFSFVLFFSLGANSTFARNFSDVPPDHRFYAAIESLVNLKIVKGYPDETFRPQQNVARIEALTMILSTAGVEWWNFPTDSNFEDVPADWQSSVVSAGVERGILSADKKTFDPTRPVNRAEFLSFLKSTFPGNFVVPNLQKVSAPDVPENAWFAETLNLSRGLGLITPDLNGNLLPGQLLDRGNCAEIIYRFLIVQRGGEPQKMLSIAEADLIAALISLKNNDAAAAIGRANSAIFYTKKTLTAVPENSVARGAEKIANGFRNLCLAYQAGLDRNHEFLKKNVEWAKMFADQAVAENPIFENLAKRLRKIGDRLLSQN